MPIVDHLHVLQSYLRKRYDDMVRMREKLRKDLNVLEEAMSRYGSEETGTGELCANLATV